MQRCLLRVVLFSVVGMLLTASSNAEVPAFRKHVLNAESEFSACAVFDVDGDGKRDIVSGGWWYKSPSWKKMFLREVTQIRGRYDDYSNLPLDVDGDGDIDLISANYRSASIFWIENPGQPRGEWTTHRVATPGPMETGRLADLDNDGDLDLLPNGTKFAAWWEIVRENGNVKWVRHDLPQQLAGHGVGAGDINGDGRTDVVSPTGWAESPVDPRNGRWVYHPDFRLHRDAGLPILVHDVDNDGDADLIWGRGHQTGLYWAEQVTTDGNTTWTQHAIDTSVTQFHSLMQADLDGNGTIELIAGQRFLGHDGKDVGEANPLVVAAYEFLPETRTFRRTTISVGDGVNNDLDPKATDVDGDGDIDLICPGRGGLSWLENLSGDADTKATGLDKSIAAIPYPDHRDVTVVRDGDGNERPVKSPFDWGLRRAHILANVERVMGPLPGPERRVPLDVQTHMTEPTEHYQRHRVSYQSEPGDRVPAWLLVPKNLSGPAPAMLCLHQTTKIGKDEPAGLGGKPNLHYAHELADRGYVCLVPDYPSFGEYPYDFKTQGAHYTSGSMKAIWNNLRGVDLLEARLDVDPDRIGVIGHSLGGHNSIFTAAFDQRLRAVITSCGFTPFHHYYGGKLKGWTSDRYMPLISSVYHNNPDEVPFDFYELIGAIAPRGFFSNSPTADSNFEVQGVQLLEKRVRPIYALNDARKRGDAQFVIVTPDSGHDFPTEIRKQAYEWLDRQFGVKR